MARRILTERQNEEQKRRLRNALYSNRTIAEVYPSVLKIQIKYEVVHKSAFGVIEESNTATYSPMQTDNFFVDCPNRECTSIGFNLKSEIWSMVREKQTQSGGSKRCEGSEAPDHMYQSCGSTFNYEIHIEYKD